MSYQTVELDCFKKINMGIQLAVLKKCFVILETSQFATESEQGEGDIPVSIKYEVISCPVTANRNCRFPRDHCAFETMTVTTKEDSPSAQRALRRNFVIPHVNPPLT